MSGPPLRLARPGFRADPPADARGHGCQIRTPRSAACRLHWVSSNLVPREPLWLSRRQFRRASVQPVCWPRLVGRDWWAWCAGRFRCEESDSAIRVAPMGGWGAWVVGMLRCEESGSAIRCLCYRTVLVSLGRRTSAGEHDHHLLIVSVVWWCGGGGLGRVVGAQCLDPTRKGN